MKFQKHGNMCKSSAIFSTLSEEERGEVSCNGDGSSDNHITAADQPVLEQWGII